MKTRNSIKNIIEQAKAGNSFGVKSAISTALCEKIKVVLANKETELAKGLFNGKGTKE